MDPLTERQAEILRLVRELTEVSGYPPTRAEIAEKMGFRSVNAAEQHLLADAVGAGGDDQLGVEVTGTRSLGQQFRRDEMQLAVARAA